MEVPGHGIGAIVSFDQAFKLAQAVFGFLVPYFDRLVTLLPTPPYSLLADIREVS